jgi:hypothetical protein
LFEGKDILYNNVGERQKNCIFQDGKILPAKEDDFVCKVIASDTNVIKNEQINNILNLNSATL